MVCICTYLVTNIHAFIQASVSYCSAMDWRYVVQLYEQNARSAVNQGICFVPKIKYEHVHLTNFSKMHVDLAAQVIQFLHRIYINVYLYF